MRRIIIITAFCFIIISLLATKLIINKTDGSTIAVDIKDIESIIFEKIPDPPEIPEGMIYVEGGTFTMGDTRGEGFTIERPIHEVTLSSFYMAKYPVTQAEWDSIMVDWEHHYAGNPDNPADNVSFYAALVYCNRRSIKEGLTPVYTINNTTNPDYWGAIPAINNPVWNIVICDWDAIGYRLLTESEWEYAARGATNDPDYLYAGSDNINEVGWFLYNSHDGEDYTTHPVGSKAPNALGIYDMSGNVWEWCWDRYSDYTSEPKQNPVGPVSGLYRTFRGGCYISSAINCRVSARGLNNPQTAESYHGLRVGITAP